MSSGTAPSTWDQQAFEALMNAEAKDRRASRKIFAPDPPQQKYITTGVDNYLTPGTLLTLGQSLTPVTVRGSVSVSLNAQDHAGLRAFGARQLGDAFSNVEDKIVLLGPNAFGPPPVGPFNVGKVTVNVDPNELGQQQGLFQPGQPAVAAGNAITSAIAALNRLRGKGHHGPFVVVVGTGLNEEVGTPVAPGILLGPVNAVLPELRSITDGWIWSDVVGQRQGVAISLGGETFDFITSYDPHVESAIVTNSFDIEAALQFRLRINDPSAIEPLQ
jgi:hypothetical protein